jgi:hypothetical protein
MAINIPIITSLEDTGIKNAKAAFNDFKDAVGKAEGGMGKFKAGSKVALDAVKANAFTFAAAAGSAIAGFAFKAIGDFQDLAISAGKFSDATGLAVEEASRYIEAAGDIGVPIDAVESAIGRLNRTIGADPDKVRDLGVDLVYLKDGSLDVNETFLNTIERIKGIKDPAEKARVAAQLLGKGWQSMAELIEGGADDLRASLDGVSESKIIDEKELKRARDFRDSMDELNDKFGDITLMVGEALMPVIQNFLDKAIALSEIDMPGWFDRVADAAELTAKSFTMGPIDAIKSMSDATEDADDQLSTYARRQTDARSDMTALTEAIEDQENGIAELTEEWKTLLGTLDSREAFDDLEESLIDLYDAGVAAFGGSAEEVRKFNSAQKDAIEQIADLAIAMDLTFGEQNKLKIFVDSGDLVAAAGYLKNIKTGYGVDLGFGVGIVPGRRALGGPVSPSGGPYIVGERGPELFTPSSSGNITPNHAMGGGSTITVNVNGADPNAVVAAIQRYVRQTGAVPLTTRAI